MPVSKFRTPQVRSSNMIHNMNQAHCIGARERARERERERERWAGKRLEEEKEKIKEEKTRPVVTTGRAGRSQFIDSLRCARRNSGSTCALEGKLIVHCTDCVVALHTVRLQAQRQISPTKHTSSEQPHGPWPPYHEQEKKQVPCF